MNRSSSASAPNFSTDRPVAVLMVFVAAVVFGYFSFYRLPVTLMPELSYPTLTVRTEYPGAAPQEVENEISRPLEEALGVIGGLNKISSISRAGLSDVVLEFLWGTEMSDATQEVLEKLDLVFLPDEAEKPLILHFDPALDPIMELSFSGEGERFEGEEGLRRLRRIADLQIKRELEPLKGVAAVRIRGGLEEEFHVLLDEEKLRLRGLSIQQVITRLRQENINVAGGTLKEGRSEYMVRAQNEFQNLQQIADTVVRREGGIEIRVKDLGTVERSHRERDIITKTDGHESVQIDIYKEADANIVAVAQAVIDRIGEIPSESITGGESGRATSGFQRKNRENQLAARLWNEEGARLQVVADRSVFIQNSIREVRNTAIFGGLLAVAILYLFLRHWKPTAIIAVSIPMSLLMSFAPLNLFGVSLNIMSLGGLAMGVGMLVDSSIVVLESIFRCQEEGDEIRAAAIRGTSEVRAAVIASTLTSICVFFPMVFVEGIAGQAFGDLGLAVVISLLASLLVAVMFIPMLASRRKIRLKDREERSMPWNRWVSWEAFRDTLQPDPQWYHYLYRVYAGLRLAVAIVFEAVGKVVLGILAGAVWLMGKWVLPGIARGGRGLSAGPLQAVNRLLEGMNRAYPMTIRWALANAGLVLVLAAGACLATWEIARNLDTELLPEVHQGEFTFEVSLPVGTPIEETERTLKTVEQAILEHKSDIHSVLVTYGYDVTNIKRSDEGEHSARFKILLQPGLDPEATEERVLERLRGYFQLPDVSQRVVRPVLFSSRTPIEVEIYGDNLAQLRETARQVSDRLAVSPVLADVETTLKPGAPEIQVLYDRDQIVRFGMNLSDVANQVRSMVKGQEATQFNLKDRRIPIVVRLDQTDRERLADIKQLTINPGGIHPVPLESVAELQIGEGPSEIRRIDSRRVALIQANMNHASMGRAVEEIEQILANEIAWPAGTSWYIAGQNEEWERSRGSLFLALGLSIFLVYVIMAAQFESLVQPFIIMFTIPLAFIGTILGLKLLGLSLSIVVFLGMIMLAGIVVNNAIVLVDYINTLQGRGLSLVEAIITAGKVRLRPILMTTATTVLGLLPMALGLGEGAEIRTPMAVSVIFGLVSSTILTLVIIPTIYYLIYRWKAGMVKSTSPEYESRDASMESTEMAESHPRARA